MYIKTLKINKIQKTILNLILLTLTIISLVSFKMLRYKIKLLTDAYKSSSLGGNLLARTMPDIACILLLVLTVIAFAIYLKNKAIYLITVAILLFSCAFMNIAEDLFLISPVNNTLFGIPISDSCAYYLLSGIVFTLVWILNARYSKIKNFACLLLLLVLTLYSIKAFSASIAGLLIFILDLNENIHNTKNIVLNLVSVLNSAIYPVITLYLFKIYRSGKVKYGMTNINLPNNTYTCSKSDEIESLKEKTNRGYGLIRLILVMSIACGLSGIFASYMTSNNIIESLMLPHSQKAFLNLILGLFGIISCDLFHSDYTYTLK